jgi:hypothetical protein
MLDQRLHYIHYNPVEAGIVWLPAHYCYSSATDYAGEKGYLDVELIGDERHSFPLQNGLNRKRAPVQVII